MQLFSPISQNLKLSQKGLLVIGIPLVFELIFIATLFVLLAQAADEIAQESKSKMFIADVQRFNTLFKDTVLTATLYAKTKNLPMGQHLSSLPAEMRKDLEHLKENAHGNKPEQALLDKVGVLLARLENYLLQVKGIFDRGGREFSLIRAGDLIQEAGYIVQETNSCLDQIVVLESESLKGSHAMAATARSNVALVLVIGVVLSVLVAVWMSLYFTRGTTVRLQTVMENMLRMAKRQPLAPPIAGSDEIGELDKFFHHMAAELSELDRLKRDLFAMASHDLRTPLTSLLMYFESYKDGVYGPVTPAAAERVDGLERSVKRMVRLIADLLDLEKLEQGKLEVELKTTGLAQVLQESVASVRDLAEHRLIDLAVPETTVELMADSERLTQVLVNLLSNAIKFSPQGSNIYIGVEAVPDSSMVRVSVKDEGAGIPADKQHLVFERYKQMENIGMGKRSGTGLGLPICKEIVQLHHGEIGIDSVPGQGSTFWFTVPVAN